VSKNTNQSLKLQVEGLIEFKVKVAPVFLAKKDKKDVAETFLAERQERSRQDRRAKRPRFYDGQFLLVNGYVVPLQGCWTSVSCCKVHLARHIRSHCCMLS
jgi:hypothetical protein